MNVEDYDYLYAYPVTVLNVEDWLHGMDELINCSTEWYQGEHRDPYDS